MFVSISSRFKKKKTTYIYKYNIDDDNQIEFRSFITKSLKLFRIEHFFYKIHIHIARITNY